MSVAVPLRLAPSVMPVIVVSPRSGLTRAEAVEWANALRADGWSYKQIAAELCVSPGYVRDLFYDPTGEKARERKRRCLMRPCVDCQTPTWGQRCEPCQHAYMQTDEYRESLRQWPAERVIAAIQAFAAEFGEPPAINDWSPTGAADLGDLERSRRGRERINRGEWPWFTVVVARFGSWNAAIAAAGYQPRPKGGRNGNQRRRRTVRARLAATERRAREPEAVQSRKGTGF